jgi:hypothetical protein
MNETGIREVSERDLLPMLPLYDKVRSEATRAARKQEQLKKPLKQWLDEHRDSGSLYDGESELEAYLEPTKGKDLLDGKNVPEAVLVWLARNGCLLLDNDMLKGWDAKDPMVLEVKKYAYPGPGGERLQVRKRRG